ncbi:MAG: hypothetical protein KDA59_07330 [Planctomycetales bacterium]|nr:hypothetical protein [Planctomycetales bacterium]MCA9221821.1 hypothetical protein [Planctomycetales bacterium]
MARTEAVADPAEQHVAILLHALGDDVASAAFDRLSTERHEKLRRELDELRKSPPSQQEIDAVLEDFERLFRFAVEAEETALKLYQAEEEDEEENEPTDGKRRRKSEEPPFVPSDDPLDDLNRLEVYQLAGALKDENPRSVALVVSQLEPARAAEVMRLLPEQLRASAFGILSKNPTAAPTLLARVARTTIQKAIQVDRKSMEAPSAEQKLADVLRAMAKATRMEMLAVIEEEDAEKAERIKQMLYVFDDILRLADRSIQKLLSEIDMDTLTMSLSGADEAIVERILGNLSKRVRESLREEMQFRGPVAEDKVAFARQQIGAALAEMDQAGELIML